MDLARDADWHLGPGSRRVQAERGRPSVSFFFSLGLGLVCPPQKPKCVTQALCSVFAPVLFHWQTCSLPRFELVTYYKIRCSRFKAVTKHLLRLEKKTADMDRNVSSVILYRHDILFTLVVPLGSLFPILILD